MMNEALIFQFSRSPFLLWLACTTKWPSQLPMRVEQQLYMVIEYMSALDSDPVTTSLWLPFILWYCCSVAVYFLLNFISLLVLLTVLPSTVDLQNLHLSYFLSLGLLKGQPFESSTSDVDR